jgi:hypothetical protein
VIEATKSNPAPLDAFETAKPYEPIWTVQGGDPLGAPLLRIWAIFARIQADIIPEQGSEAIYSEILRAARENIPDDKRNREDLLVRATQTEEISWTFDEYRKGIASYEITEQKPATALDQLDIYDLRRRCASLISSFASELNEYRWKLKEYNFLTEEIDNAVEGTLLALKSVREQIDIRRIR